MPFLCDTNTQKSEMSFVCDTNTSVNETNLDTTEDIPAARSTAFFQGPWFCFFVAIFLDARFQKCLIFVKELLSWLVKWRHWLANQCHAVCWRHIFRLTQIAWNPSGVLNSTWYLVLPVNGKLSKAVLSSYLWKRPIILNTTAYLSIVCILL